MLQLAHLLSMINPPQIILHQPS